MRKHTPGPWEWLPNPSGYFELVHRGADLSQDEEVLAPYGYDCMGLALSDENACLIAAAPDLLKAAEAVLATEGLQPAEAFASLEAAVKKARGES